MTLNILNKINRAAFEMGQETKHNVMVDYYSATNNVCVTVWKNGNIEDREVMNSIHMKPETILFKLLSLLNEGKEIAA